MMNKLKELRHARGVPQQLLADLLHVTKATYSRYENGQFEPTQASLIQLADYFHVTIDYLLGRKIIKTEIGKSTKIPIFHQITSDIPIHVTTDIDGYEEISRATSVHGDYFAFRMPDSSMEPELHQNDVVIASHQNDITATDLCIVFIGHSNATVRKVQKEKDGVLIIGYNFSSCVSHFYTSQETRELPIKIIGTVTEIRRKLK